MDHMQFHDKSRRWTNLDIIQTSEEDKNATGADGGPSGRKVCGGERKENKKNNHKNSGHAHALLSYQNDH